MSFSLSLRNVSFSYGDHELFTGVTFSLGAGEVVALEASSGAGKSTFLKLCAGLLSPTAGEVLIDQKRFWHLSLQEQCELRGRMGFFFQEAALIANMTVFNNLALPLRYRGRFTEAHITKLIEEWLGVFNLMRYRDLFPAALSLGLRRQVGLIRTLMVDAALLFWDEPVEGARPEVAAKIAEIIQTRKKQGIASLIALQDSTFLRGSIDRVMQLVDGRLVDR